jgi:hypothetical protein
VVIEFERKLDDMIQFNLFHLAHSPSSQRQIWIMRFLTALLVFPLIQSLIYLANHSLNLSDYVISFLCGILMFIGYPYINQAFTVRSLRKMLGEGENTTMLGRCTISLTPEGIFSKTANSEGKLNWTTVQKTVQNDHYIFMYTGAVNAIVIPKKAFATDKSQEEFLDYVSANVKNKNV